MTKPLFIPLKTEYYEAFARGDKKYEYRKYSARWNERHCYPGRAAILSKGYGKGNRLAARVLSFKRVPAARLEKLVQADIQACFGTLDIDIAVIGFEDIRLHVEAAA